MSEDIAYLVALKSLSGVGDVLAKQLISYCGSAKNVFHFPVGKLKKIPMVGDKFVKSISAQSTLAESKDYVAQCEEEGVKIIPYYSPEYPDKLKMVNDAPLYIHYKGNLSYNDRKVVGIVGTRNATSYGKDLTGDIVDQLQAHDPVIVSGLAYGIDVAAHKSALRNDMSTIGVLAGGVDWIYPAAHRKVACDMQDRGGLMSERDLGSEPDRHYFAARNRIIAGMSDVLIVVEAGEKGGALITANLAHSYNREVFAVPGNLDSLYSKGCNTLIRDQKANIYTRVEDIEYLLNWDKNTKASHSASPVKDMTSDEKLLFEIMKSYPSGIQLDELSWKSQMSVNTVVSLLLTLEFSGVVSSLPGKVYKLKSL